MVTIVTVLVLKRFNNRAELCPAFRLRFLLTKKITDTSVRCYNRHIAFKTKKNELALPSVRPVTTGHIKSDINQGRENHIAARTLL